MTRRGSTGFGYAASTQLENGLFGTVLNDGLFSGIPANQYSITVFWIGYDFAGAFAPPLVDRQEGVVAIGPQGSEDGDRE